MVRGQKVMDMGSGVGLDLGAIGSESGSVPDSVPVLDLEHNKFAQQDYWVNQKSLIDFHKSLVDINSISRHEYEVAMVLKSFLEDQGLTVELQQVGNNRYNVFSYIKTPSSKVLLTSHIDTVPPYIPYSVDGTKIYGRGTCDAKGSVASQVFSFLSLWNRGLIKDGDVSMLFVVGEEINGDGMKVANDQFNNTSFEVGIFGEPTELKLGVGHKGIFLMTIQVDGKASHSGYPELGISASEIMIPVLNDLLALDLPHDDLLGPTTMNVGKVDIGVAANVVPASANASISIRISADLPKVVEMVKEKVDGVEHLTYEIEATIPPVYLDYKVEGFESIVLAYATDVPNFHKSLKKRYLYGPGSIHVAHGDNEFVERGDLVAAVSGYNKLIMESVKN
ncbi:hypothetical protein CLIB1444_24S00408 [[Candida] jaroonii]|uniref:Uncharacterized protein n=1 Tax=[Candida] jaroonii TaxID=467808 RepID=A0ACA9YGD6_9ASCO|nr:hypothetical protein CLIB1444_24S00408 [[Candida] jaroonii]